MPPIARCFLKLLTAAITAGAVSATVLAASAPHFPSRPITLIVPFAPGLASDTALRSLADAAGKQLGQPIVVANMPGENGTLGAMALLKAPADGYTLSQVAGGTFRVPALLSAAEPEAQFTWIIGVSAFAYGVAVNATSPWRTWQEYVAAARTNAGKITYAVSGLGGTHHRTMEAIASRANVKWEAVLYRDGGEGLQALLSGKVDALVGSTGWGDLIKAGKIRMLVSWGSERPAQWPEVPTLKELGYDIVAEGPYGLIGPRNMDPAVTQKLHDAFRKAMDEPRFRSVLAELGQEPWYRTGTEFRRYAANEFAEQRKTAGKP